MAFSCTKNIHLKSLNNSFLNTSQPATNLARNVTAPPAQTARSVAPRVRGNWSHKVVLARTFTTTSPNKCSVQSVLHSADTATEAVLISVRHALPMINKSTQTAQT